MGSCTSRVLFRWFALFGGIATSLASCNLLWGLDELGYQSGGAGPAQGGAGAGGIEIGGGGSASGGSGGAISTSGGSGGSGGCDDTQTDPSNCGSCNHDCLGGACVAGKCQPVTLASGQTSPTVLALSNTHVIWTNWSAMGAVMHVKKAGGSATALVSNLSAPVGLAVGGSYAYYGTVDTGVLGRVGLGGSKGAVLSTEPVQPALLALDSSYLYWPDFAQGTINRMVKAGGAIQVLSSGEVAPQGIAVDGGTVYWTNTGTPAQQNIDGAIRQLPLNSLKATTVASSQHAPQVIVVYDSELYWTNAGSVETMSSNGSLVHYADGKLTVLASSLPGPYGLAVDATGVYWASRWDGKIMRIPDGGSKPETLAADLPAPLFVATDATAVYWTNSDDGSVRRLAK